MGLYEDYQAASAADGRARKQRWLLFGSILLLAGLAGVAYWFWNRDRDEDQLDPRLVQELQDRQLAVAPPESIRPGDWPQWRGPLRDGLSRETGLLTDWPATGPAKLWEAPSGDGFSSLAIADGRLYTIVQDGGGFGKGSLVIADGHLIIFGENGKLGLAEATPDAYK